MQVVATWTDDDALLAQVAASCNHAALPDLGDPTEVALLQHAAAAHRLSIDEEVVPFTSEGKYMRTRHGAREFIKGGPERVLGLCDAVPDGRALRPRPSPAAGSACSGGRSSTTASFASWASGAWKIHRGTASAKPWRRRLRRGSGP